MFVESRDRGHGLEHERLKAEDGLVSWVDPSQRRRRHRRILAGIVLLGGAVAAVALFLWIRPLVPRSTSIARIGAILPAFPVVDRSGRVVDASKARLGKRTIIVFYSPSCDVCRSELPKLQPIPPGLDLIMIDISGSPSEEADSSGFHCDALFHDRDRVFERSFSMTSLPTVLFVDERGVLDAALAGEHPRDLVRDKLTGFAKPTIER